MKLESLNAREAAIEKRMSDFEQKELELAQSKQSFVVYVNAFSPFRIFLIQTWHITYTFQKIMTDVWKGQGWLLNVRFEHFLRNVRSLGSLKNMNFYGINKYR